MTLPTDDDAAPPASRSQARSGWVVRLISWLFFFPLTLLALLGGGVVGVTLYPPDLTPYHQDLARFLTEQTGLRVSLTGIELETGLSLALVGTGVEIGDPEAGNLLFAAERMLLRVSPLLLVRGGLPMAITLEKARATLRRDVQGRLHLGERGLAESPASQENPIGMVLLNALTVSDGELTWVDETVVDEGKPVRLRLTGIHARGFLESGPARLTVEAALPDLGPQSRVFLNGERDAAQQWFMRVRGENWLLSSLRPYLVRAPPLDGLTTPVDLVAEVSGGSLATLKVGWQVTLGEGHLAWPALFRWPIPVTRLTARGRVENTPAGWHVDVGQFALRSSHGQAEGKVLVTGIAGPGSPFMDLTAHASGNPADKAKFYYPTPIMDPGLVNWLDNALKDGQVRQASAHIRGHLANMPAGPKDPPQDRFHIEADVTGLTLHYFPPFLPLRELSTHVIFDRYSMTAQVADGSYGATRKVKGEVKITNMVDHPVVD
ncbi:MAG: hypothetical protein HQL95_15405, partial [Magnetococcales bacterium]|nr:hypothetical protein [Magnetococcales bacterium]